jgi:predicted ArsR family transcriptional regulator
MPLSSNESSILLYLAKHRTATAGNITRDLHLNRTAVRRALRGLADKKMASVDHATFPASWSITDMGAAVVAAAATERGDQ